MIYSNTALINLRVTNLAQIAQPIADIASTEELNIAVNSARTHCEAKGFKFTELREQVLKIILLAGKPIGAYDIMAELEMRTDRDKVAPPTVYRTLDFLCKNEIVVRVHSLNAYLPTEIKQASPLIALLICRQCGASFKTSSNTIQQSLNLAANEFRFKIEEPVLEILGCCSECDNQ